MSEAIRLLNRQFGEILLDVSVQLSRKETADNSYFIGAALGILERRGRSGRLPSEALELGPRTLVKEVMHNLSEPIIEQLESGISPPWGPSLARLLADERFAPIHATESLVDSTSMPFLHHGDTISVDADYASKWVAICCSMEDQSLVTDWEVKRRIVQTFAHLLMWHFDVAVKELSNQENFQLEEIFKQPLKSHKSPLSRLLGTLNQVISFLDDNSAFLEPSPRNMLLLILFDAHMGTLKLEWKGSPSNLQKWDTIILKDSDLDNLEGHFNDWDLTFKTTSLVNPLETKRIPKKSLTAGIFFVTSVESLTQSVSLVFYNDFQPGPKHDSFLRGDATETEKLHAIKEWVVLRIQEEEGFITLSDLGNRWAKEKGTSLRTALAPHGGMKVVSLIKQIVEEREDLFWTKQGRTDGGRVRVLKKRETRASLEELTATQMQNKLAPDWISDWHIPKNPRHLWEHLEIISNELNSTPSQEWMASFAQRARPDRADHGFISLINTQAMNTEEWRRKHGDPSDISPQGLLDNMISAILNRASYLPHLDHGFIENHLNELRDSVLAHCPTPHVPIMSWRDEEKAVDTVPQLDPEKLEQQQAQDLQREERLQAYKDSLVEREEEVRRRRMLSKFGPIVNSPNLISDYLRALSAAPESEDEFLKYAKKAYSERIKSGRTRYVGVGKSDKYVWKFWGLGRDLELPPESPEEVIKLFLLDAGLLEDKVKSLLEQSRKVQYPYAEKE